MTLVLLQHPDQGVRAAEEPLPGDPRRGPRNAGEDHGDAGLPIPSLPAERDAVGPG